MNKDDILDQMTLDQSAMYQEATFTDQKVGTIRRLIPVDEMGEHDSARETLYIGQTQMMSPMGALPIQFEIPASNLSEAIAGFPPNAQIAVEKTIEDIQKMQREQASSIVMPGQGSQGGIQLP